MRPRPGSAFVSLGRYGGSHFGRRNPFVGPVADRDDRRFECATFIRQFVFDAHGCCGKHIPLDDAFRLELAQAFGEHAVADVGDVLADLVVSGIACEHCADYCAGPAATNQLDRLVILGANRFLAHIVYVNMDRGIDNSYLSKYSSLSRVTCVTPLAGLP